MARSTAVSARDARRIALASSGLGGRRPAAPGSRHVQFVLRDLGQLQIDSVNVYERAHYLPLLSRLGPYETAALDGLAGRHSIEYWPHQAGIIPTEDWPLWQWRRDEFRASRHGWWLSERTELCEWLVRELASNGPMTSRAIEHDENRSRGAWWGWSDVKIALEYMWRVGDVVCLRRNRFERVYELPSGLPTVALARSLSPVEQH
ncbi:MAG TPA: crosslink repair DNA glycosylase YcaQ family protein, partial [Microbacteriaceae bacterium]|nr:crosslink repair DNA glycosylase YcaQ family protein [Microbacteriaceae bacterium]